MVKKQGKPTTKDKKRPPKNEGFIAIGCGKVMENRRKTTRIF